MKRYNIDEFYGIELEEQHIKAPSADDKFSHLPFELKSKLHAKLFNHIFKITVRESHLLCFIAGGVRGVYDVGEICDLLRVENMCDVFAVSVPPELNYVEHLVIATGVSKRHLRAVAGQVKMIVSTSFMLRITAEIFR